MTVKEWEKVFEMSQDKNLYHNLCTSLFPTIHGKSSVCEGDSTSVVNISGYWFRDFHEEISLGLKEWLRR